MPIDFNGKFGNVNNTQVSGKKIDAEDKKSSSVKGNVFDSANEIDNKFQGEKTDLAKDPKAIYGAMGLSLGNIKKPDFDAQIINIEELDAQITNIVGASVMKRVAATLAKSAEKISTTADLAYDEVLADDTPALFAMAGLNAPVNAPSLESMQQTLYKSPTIKTMFA